MKTIFVYGFEKYQMAAIRWRFGEANYVDVTPLYQDILAMNAEVVVISLENIPENALAVVKQYEDETKDVEEREYYYLTNEDYQEWDFAFYDKLDKAIVEAAKGITDEQLFRLSLFYIHKNEEGYIAKIWSEESRQLIFVEFFRPKLQTTELIIFSFGDDISRRECELWQEKGGYDRVSLDWNKELVKERCLEGLYYDHVDISELHPVLQPLKTRLDELTAEFEYAYWGDEDEAEEADENKACE